MRSLGHWTNKLYDYFSRYQLPDDVQDDVESAPTVRHQYTNTGYLKFGKFSGDVVVRLVLQGLMGDVIIFLIDRKLGPRNGGTSNLYFI